MFQSPRDVLSWKRDTDWVQSENIESLEQTVRYNCGECSDSGWSSETEVELHRMDEHVSIKHLRSTRFNKENLCCICVQKFNNQEEVLKHIKTEHLLSSENATRIEREIFICNECSAIFFSKTNLLYHTSYWHNSVKSNRAWTCPICNKNVKNLYYAPGHFYKHVKKSLSTCRICLMKCKNTAQLREHYKKHPYFLKCEMCYFDTNRLDSYHNHLQQHHKVDQDDLVIGDDYKRCFIPKAPSYLRLQKLVSPRGLRLANDIHICILCREICTSEEGMKRHVIKHQFKSSVIIVGYVCSCGQIFTNKVLFKHHIFKSKHKISTDVDTSQNCTKE